MVQVRLVEDEAARRLCLRLRWTVFVEEQGVPPSLEVDQHDSSGAVHALGLLDGVPAGTGRFVFVEPGLARIGRMAVLDHARGKGLGRTLLRFLEEKGLLRHVRDGVRYVYLPTVAPSKARKSALQRLVHTFFGGSAQEAVAALLEDTKLRKGDLDRLQDLIDQARKEGR